MRSGSLAGEYFGEKEYGLCQLGLTLAVVPVTLYVLGKSVLELREHHALAKTNKVHKSQALAAPRSLDFHSEDKGAPDTVQMVNPLAA